MVQISGISATLLLAVLHPIYVELRHDVVLAHISRCFYVVRLDPTGRSLDLAVDCTWLFIREFYSTCNYISHFCHAGTERVQEARI